ncbi:MAG: hypothetical protein HQ581_17965 [Planctomycetes bacterium]|nr:hypothetical protein [Planctomycetota bacterium]
MDNDLYKQRRRWFESYVERVSNGVVKPPIEGVRYTCPCCGYLTLDERGGYDICELCNWEDDGQDDPHADEIYGGPNGRYSLAEARENFRKYLVMYPPEDDTRIGGADSEKEREAKKSIMAAFDEMWHTENDEPVKDLWEVIRQSEATLDSETNRKIREYERLHKP